MSTMGLLEIITCKPTAKRRLIVAKMERSTRLTNDEIPSYNMQQLQNFKNKKLARRGLYWSVHACRNFVWFTYDW